MKKRITLIVLDLAFLVIALWVSLGFKPVTLLEFIARYYIPVIVFTSIWVSVSLVFKKYSPEGMRYTLMVKRILLSNILSSVFAITLMYLFRQLEFSRLVVFATILLATLFNMVMYAFWYLIKQSKEMPDEALTNILPEMEHEDSDPLVQTDYDPEKFATIKWAVEGELGMEAFDFISQHTILTADTTLIVSTTTQFNIDNQPTNYFRSIVNLKRMNDIRWINKFLESVNSKLPSGGIFICLAETKDLRKGRILKKYPPVLNYLYYMVDFVVKRLFPKFGLTKGIYFFLTRGQNRVLSRAEVLGRLYSCGFKVIQEKFIDSNLFVACQKVARPAFDLEATYGPLIKLKRVGKDGKLIKVYKMRTMHPYAEYLQEYMYNAHNLQDGGKFKDDFRISTIGRLMRKLWIDELPMFINFFRGELKLVGVRPLSMHYYSLYTKELQEKRIKVKPGLIPPFYADNPKTLEEIMDSENRYLDEYMRRPFWTDFRYFFKSVYNIIIKNYRSN